jgi:hypothetical protein
MESEEIKSLTEAIYSKKGATFFDAKHIKL